MQHFWNCLCVCVCVCVCVCMCVCACFFLSLNLWKKNMTSIIRKVLFKNIFAIMDASIIIMMQVRQWQREGDRGTCCPCCCHEARSCARPWWSPVSTLTRRNATTTLPLALLPSPRLLDLLEALCKCGDAYCGWKWRCSTCISVWVLTLTTPTSQIILLTR